MRSEEKPPGPEELVERYGGMAYNLALRLTGNPRDAEDLAQDSLVRAIRGLPRFRGDADPGTWLYRIVHNTWKNRVRSEKRRRFWSIFSLDRKDEDDPVPEPADDSPPLDRGLEAEEAGGAVQAALAALDPEDRAILALRELDGRSYAEIAAALEVPVGTVKSRISRARAVLKSKLEPYIHGTRRD
jgi:RNA polymerase sigma-70 factor (ECF subfamily)